MAVYFSEVKAAAIADTDAKHEIDSNHIIYVKMCGPGKVLTGFTGRTGANVDQLQGICKDAHSN